MKKVLFSLFFVFTFVISANAYVKPSFNCNYAKSYVEKRICVNSSLARIDNRLADKYNSIMSVISKYERIDLEADTANWVKKRDRFCDGEADSCIQKMYLKRISYLDRYASRLGMYEEPKTLSSNKISFGNEFLDAKVIYKVSGNKAYIDILVDNTYKNSKGGVSVSFPQFISDRRIINASHDRFSSFKSYRENSKLWSNSLKRTIRSSYLLVEGWQNSWKKYKIQTISLTVDMSNMNELVLNVRAALAKGKKQALVPTFGQKDQQGFPVKQIIIRK